MKYSKVELTGIGYELAPVVVTSEELESRLRPMLHKLHIAEGQLEFLTGISERRWWAPGTPVSRGATAAARKVLASTGVPVSEIGSLIYAGVCRENYEPATACRVADGLGVEQSTAVYDISNACLGVLNGMLEIANRIELGQIRAGLVVSCESAREINDVMIERMLQMEDMKLFTLALATLTGGSGAVAVLLTDGSFGADAGHQLLGGVTHVAPEHHELCRWGIEQVDGVHQPFMSTDSVAVLKHGVALGKETWKSFLAEMGWSGEDVSRVVCHQVGSGHQNSILQTLGIAPEKDFTTYEYLGNIGTVSLPLTAALAHERSVLKRGDKVSFLGIGSGLNCMMLGLKW
ncbi:MAG: 3-oxoacyl-ACP synthase III [Verrucomicrobiia bacterium]|jgi:3-oxoacyl-[acyl-carrier-protein] synthase III